MSRPHIDWRAYAVPMLTLLAATMLTSGAHCQKPVVQDASSLRLVPFPKQVKMLPGGFVVSSGMNISVSDSPSARQAAMDLSQELAISTNTRYELWLIPLKQRWALTISASKGSATVAAASLMPKEIQSQQEGYSISISAKGVGVGSGFEQGLVNGIQTIRQLVRANMRGKALPCLSIADWPSMRYRGYMDDITRGPSPTLQTLKMETAEASFLKMNFFTYYLEHQYQYPRLPLVGPKGGSLTPQELKSLVQYSKLFNIEIIGCQQSFGHFAEILKYDQYKALRENPYILNPTNEDSYKLLDDMYSAQAPITESKYFIVCCDETQGLGLGPSKELADRIGVGGVYAGHIKRIHDILKDKYGKRIMMWGDIILTHPENLKDIPKDTVMLSWGYEALPSFESSITPFTKSGYDFLVCPGVSCWSRILPDFDKAVVNIQNYVRDGAKFGAMGMLNTTWDDGGANLVHYNWHGLAWGAECAWNASTTDIKDFNRRIGAVMFGEKGDHFGQAIGLLAKTHKLLGYEGMMEPRFWRLDDGHVPVTRETARRQAKAVVDLVEPALKHLYAAKKDARINTQILDCFIFGAEQMRIMATRQLDFLDAAKIYEYAWQSTADREKASVLLVRAADSIRVIRDQHVALRDRYRILWNRENRPYALDRVTGRYDNLIQQYDSILTRLLNSSASLKKDGVLPSPVEMGLDIAEQGARATRPARIVKDAPESAKAEWADPAFRKRIGITVENMKVVGSDRPIELDIPVDAAVPDFFRLYQQGTVVKLPVPVQVATVDGHKRIYFMAKGQTSADGKHLFFLYFDPDAAMADVSLQKGTSLITDGKSSVWMENEKVRLLIGAEGGHIFRWEVKEFGNSDITEPGESGWAGFADNYSEHRYLPNRIDALADGDVLVRVKCADPTGMEKTISLWAGCPWAEVTYNTPSNWFSCYDDISLMGAGSSTPGSCLFSDGYTEKIKPTGEAASSQTMRDGVYWSSKYVQDGILFGLITPELPSRHVAGPGSGMGGLMIEGGPSSAHFVIYGGKCPASVKETLDRLRESLDFTNQPAVSLTGAMERG